MWLLDTHTGRLQFFNRPEDVPGGYAILSHIWGEVSEEDTFEKVQEAAKKCDGGALSGTSRASVDEVIAQLQKEIEQLKRTVGTPSTRGEQPLSREPMSSEEARPFPPTAMMASRATQGDSQPTVVVQGVCQDDIPSPATDPRDFLSRKIRNFLKQAEAGGAGRGGEGRVPGRHSRRGRQAGSAERTRGGENTERGRCWAGRLMRLRTSSRPRAWTRPRRRSPRPRPRRPCRPRPCSPCRSRRGRRPRRRLCARRWSRAWAGRSP